MKLVVADLDGTLVHQKKMSEGTLETIKKLKEEGVYFTVATGRHKDATRKLVNDLGIEIPVVLTNGACIYDYQKEEIIFADPINQTDLIEILKIIKEKEVSYLIYTSKRIVSNEVSKDKLEKRIGQFESTVVSYDKLYQYFDEGVLKVLVIEDEDDKLNNLKKELEAFDSIYLLQSQPKFLDIGNKMASKGRALERLVKSIGISLDDVLAIGDQENDLSMIEVAGVGVAMGNAEEILKTHANFITKPVTEDGFSYAIDTLVRKK